MFKRFLFSKKMLGGFILRYVFFVSLGRIFDKNFR